MLAGFILMVFQWLSASHIYYFTYSISFFRDVTPLIRAQKKTTAFPLPHF
jgi:hypothetical protein